MLVVMMVSLEMMMPVSLPFVVLLLLLLWQLLLLVRRHSQQLPHERRPALAQLIWRKF